MSVLTSVLYTRLSGAGDIPACGTTCKGSNTPWQARAAGPPGVAPYRPEPGAPALAQGAAVPIVVCRWGQALEAKAVQALQEGLDTDEVNRSHGRHIERVPQGLA